MMAKLTTSAFLFALLAGSALRDAGAAAGETQSAFRKQVAANAAAPTAQPAPAAERKKYLLLDSRIVDRTDNARLAVGAIQKNPGNPLFREDQPWEVRFDNLYANVLYDEQEQVYKCWYSPFIVDEAASQTPREQRTTVPYRPRGREMGVCYATSRDGLTWMKPDLGLVEFQGSRANNLVVRGPHGAGVFRDLREPDPQRRYKMFYQGMHVRFSADGLHWSEAVPCPEIAARGDTHNNACWCNELSRYVGITRLWDGQRIVGRCESPDFRRWTKAAEVMRGDRDNQTYAMPVFRYADVYLGLVMVFRPQPSRVHCELAWSPDTLTWHRIDQGTPLIPLSEKPGDFDWGCAYAAAYPVVLAEEIRLYYGASNGTHNGWRDGFLALAQLRPDGWAGFVPKDDARPAIVVTQPIHCASRTLQVTAEVRAGGSVKVTVLDGGGQQPLASGTLTAGATDAVVSEVGPHRGQAVRVRFDIARATVYAFAFGGL